jgi:hypothetical protein
VQISTREYRHMAMMNKTRDWHENLKLRERDFALVIASLPSFHTAHVDVYLHRLGKFWNTLGFFWSSPRNTPSCGTSSSRTA